MDNPVQIEPYSLCPSSIIACIQTCGWRDVVFTESNLLSATLQNENEIVSGIRTAYAADRFALRQGERRKRRRARVEISAGDVERMVKEFAAMGGGVVRCPPAYAVQSDQYHN
jgi:hypothetical protein